MKPKGWDYRDHMLQTCEELFECMQNVDSADDLMASVVKRRAVTMCLLDLGELFKVFPLSRKDYFHRKTGSILLDLETVHPKGITCWTLISSTT